MQRYILGRLGQAVLCLMAIAVIVFILGRMTGNPLDMMMPPDATQAQYDMMSKKLGLDKPYIVQFWRFISGAVMGDFGVSIRYQVPAMGLVFERFPATLQLTLVAITICILIAFPIGLWSAVKRDSIFDRFGKIAALAGQSMPIFWVGLMLMWIFAVFFELLPPAGRGGPANIILPAITLGWYVNAALMRIARSSMIDVLDSEYIKLARLKGLPKKVVILKHALKNAAIPIVTLAGIQFAGLLRGAVVTETVFAWPGLGRLAVSAVYARDFPLIQASVLFMALIFILMNLIVDILYAYLDPRIRYD